MNRTLHYLNTAGVVVLIAICLWQWRSLRDEEQRITALDTAQRELQGKYDEQTKVLKGKAADLEDFRSRLQSASADLSETRSALDVAQQRADRLEQEKVQLTDNIAAWKTAVEQRDAHIQEANTRIGELSERLNASIKKFNALVTDYNDLVAKVNAMNEAAARNSSAAPSDQVGDPPRAAGDAAPKPTPPPAK